MRRLLRHRGMTLVELMVGMAVGLFLVAVMGSIYVGSKGTFQSQESTSRLQENGRFALDTLAADLRMSGFKGCLGQAKVANFLNTLNTATAVIYNYSEPVWGSRYSGGSWTPALTTPINGLSARTEGDVLVVRRPLGQGWALTNDMASATGTLTITPTATIVQGDLLLVADCNYGALLQATNAAPGTGGSIAHTVGAAGVSPGVSSADLGSAFRQDASVWRMQTIVYYLANSVRRTGQLALWSYTAPNYSGGAQAVELVTGVERLAIVYGLDSDGDGAADQFRAADQVANWAQVVSARVELLLVGSEDSVTSTPQPYVFNGVTTTPSDRRMRTVMSLAAVLRNTVP